MKTNILLTIFFGILMFLLFPVPAGAVPLTFYLDTSSSPTSAELYSVEATTGALNAERSFATTAIEKFDPALAIDNTGNFYAISVKISIPAKRALVTLDPSTGLATKIGMTGISGKVGAMAFNTENQLYAIDTDNDILYSIDTTTGTATLLKNLIAGYDGGDFVIDGVSDLIYVNSSGDINIINLADPTYPETESGKIPSKSGQAYEGLLSVDGTLYALDTVNNWLYPFDLKDSLGGTHTPATVDFAEGDAATIPEDTIPSLVESCDALDNDGDGDVDEGFDADGDLVTTCAGDCDDTTSSVAPGVVEICADGIDQNCDGVVDEGCTPPPPPPLTIPESCDGIDNNENGTIDEGFDADADGFTSCGGDCDDSTSNVNPGVAEICGDSIDQNCDGADEACPPPPAGSGEICDDGLDNDGDNLVDEDCPVIEPPLPPIEPQIVEPIGGAVSGGGGGCGCSFAENHPMKKSQILALAIFMVGTVLMRILRAKRKEAQKVL